MALGLIPWHSIIDWCAFHGIYDPDTIDKFLRYVRFMEKIQNEHAEKKGQK